MEKLIEVRNLAKYFEVKSGGPWTKPAVLRAVDGVSFDVFRGETLGIVGESGCGKSTLGRTILGLLEKTSGEVLHRGEDIFSYGRSQMKAARKDMQMIFQDPFSSLNPRRKVRSIIAQPLKIHRAGTAAEIAERTLSLMAEVGLNREYRNRYPHQFSGGQRQRIGIARALALNPDFVVCDEAVSALDVSVQAQIVNLLLELQERHGLTYVFIAHDLAVVEFVASRIVVMYLGRIVETAGKQELRRNRLHPYTKALFEAFPSADPRMRGDRKPIVLGDVPSAIDPPSGCHFHPRCPAAMDVCRRVYPEITEPEPGHQVSCHLF